MHVCVRVCACVQVLELEPAYTDASLALVTVLHALGKSEAALQLLDELAAAQPELRSWCEQQAGPIRAALAPGGKSGPE